YAQVVDQVKTLYGEFPGQLGLVVGATQPAELNAIRQQAPTLPFLVPGIGAQGGDLAATVRDGLTRDGIGPLINTGRSVLYASQDGDFASAARARVLALREEIETLKQRHVLPQ